jgi:hypothetical protein
MPVAHKNCKLQIWQFGGGGGGVTAGSTITGADVEKTSTMPKRWRMMA